MAGRPRVVKADVITMRADGMTLQTIADHFGVSKAAISLALSRQTSRTNAVRAPQPCACGCGRTHIRRKYASRECYFAHVTRDGVHVAWRWGCKLARLAVSALFPLEPAYIVHHVDRDNTNNALKNLWVFASHGDHMSYHRGGVAQPIWRGDGGPCGEPRMHRA